MDFLDHPKKLFSDHGVRGVVNMCAEYSGPIDAYAKLDMKQLRLPTVDHYESTLDQMIEGVQFIEKFKAKKEKVYIHCKAGHGRAAAMALCWLIHENKDMSPRVSVNISTKNTDLSHISSVYLHFRISTHY